MRGFLRVCFRQGRGLIIRMLLLTLLLATLLPVSLQPAGAQDQEEITTTIRLDPADRQISPGGTVTTEVRLDDVSNLVKVRFVLRFDPNVVQVVDSADPSKPATQIVVGGLVEKWFPHRNEVWNEDGFIRFDYDLPSEIEPVSGPGLVASITWRGVGEGVSELTFDEKETRLGNSDGVPIHLSKGNGRIEVIPHTATPTLIPTATHTPPPTPTDTPSPTHTATPMPTTPPPDTPTFTPPAVDTPTDMPTDTPIPTLEPSHTPAPTPMIRGIVLLQGRTVHAGTNIFLGEDRCSGPLSGPPAAVTNDAGYFEITPVPGRTYQCLQVIRPGYLIGEKSLPQGDLGTITLPGGDVTQDNVVDISDLTFIANHYRSKAENEAEAADLNGDKWVDIYDLAIASGNCCTTNGPVTNWQ